MRLKNRILILERLQNIEWRALGTLALLVHICMYVNVYIYIYIYYVLFYFVCLFHIVCASCMCGSTVAPAAFAWADSSATINMASSFSPAASQWRVECDGLQVNAADATGKGRKRKKKGLT